MYVRLVTELLPSEPEPLGLLALMLYAEARRHARRNLHGEYVPLAEQDPALWDSQIVEAEALLERASALGSIGRYQLEGALQSAHVYRCRTGHDNWAEVVQLYDALLGLSGSPVVAINRALAIEELHGPNAALDAMQDVAADVRLAEYQPYWAARRAAGQGRRTRRSPPRVRNRHRSRARPVRPPLPPAASVRVSAVNSPLGGQPSDNIRAPGGSAESHERI
jgi:predicted RNA polymerase sigma factor